MQSLLFALVILGISAPASEKAASADGTASATLLPTQSKVEKSLPPGTQDAPTTPVRIMSIEKEQRLRKLLPRVDDVNLQRIFKDPRLIFYTEEEMPAPIKNGAAIYRAFIRHTTTFRPMAPSLMATETVNSPGVAPRECSAPAAWKHSASCGCRAIPMTGRAP